MAEGVLEQHRRRMEEDEAYRRAALSIDPNAPGGGALGKANDSDIPTSLSVDQSNVDDLAGEELDKAVAEANIEGRSSMTADEKRKALRDQA